MMKICNVLIQKDTSPNNGDIQETRVSIYIRGPLRYLINTCPKRDFNLGLMAFFLLEFEIASKTTQPPRLDCIARGLDLVQNSN